jgi:pimeloyl-ACP methyl ester carboxylesterase
VTIWSDTPIQTRFRVVDGLSIRFAGSEDRTDHALLLSPWPESLFAFEPMWVRLAERTHLVAVDLPGFGRSQRRDALLSPRTMGDFVIRVADAFGLKNPHVIGPDVGTGAALFAAALHPGRLRSLVVGGGGTAYPLRLGGVLRDWVEAVDLDGYRGADPGELVAGALAGIERYALPDGVREDYLSSYDGDRYVESMCYVRAYPTQLAVLRDLLPWIQTPVQIIAGARDPVVLPVNAEFLHERLPRSRLDIIDADPTTAQTAVPGDSIRFIPGANDTALLAAVPTADYEFKHSSGPEWRAGAPGALGCPVPRPETEPFQRRRVPATRQRRRPIE